MRMLAAALLVAAATLAGCTADDRDDPVPTPSPTPDPVPDALLFHRGGELVPDGLRLETLTFPLGTETFEPTLGIDADGALFYSVTPDRGVAVGFGPGVYRSLDGGETWEDVSPELASQNVPPETNDPFLYVDPATGRVFQFAMAPILTCSVLSWSDDQGGSWTSNPRGCGNPPPWDHQSMVAAAPRTLVTAGYPSVLHQCVNQVAGAACSRSVDGGLTWVAGPLVYSNTNVPTDFFNCPGSSVHGHPAAAPDGTVYLPSGLCGHEAIVSVTRDDGTTWTTVTVSAIVPSAGADPAVAVDASGTAYYVFEDDEGQLWLSTSQDSGATWSEAVLASPPGLTAHKPTVAAGAGGRIVIAYPGTADVQGYGSESKLADSRWNAYLTVSLDADQGANATFATVRSGSSEDPIVRGACGPDRCPGIVDFIDVVVGPDGRAYAAFVDACVEACAEDDSQNNASQAILVRLEQALLADPAPAEG